MSGSGQIRFDGRVAIVSGGGRGLGRAYALELATRGATVVVNDPGGALDGSGSSGTAEDVVGQIKGVGGVASASTLPVGGPDAAEALLAETLEAYGRCDILINSAGILRDRSVAKMTAGEFEAVLDVHLRGPFYLSQAAFRQMKVQGYGRILLTASSAGVFGNFGQANYSAAKLGSVGLMQVLAIEGAKYGIMANAVTPLAVTRMSTTGLIDGMPERMTPELVAPIALYLVSEDSTITHRVFSAGGGHFAEVVIGVTPGWSAAAPVTVEQVQENFQAISEKERVLQFWDALAELAHVENQLDRDLLQPGSR
jgi:NAD(P)-dependent dehydrogenase (short-subunit alcohol dehydrogenase family)